MAEEQTQALSLKAAYLETRAWKNWSPEFIDYVFLAFNTSTAFSPNGRACVGALGESPDDEPAQPT